MKTDVVRRIALLLLLAGPVAAFAGPNDVLVLFNGNTEGNRHVYALLTQVLSSPAGGGYKVVGSLKPSGVTPGTYKAVVVVSTKATSGVEPALAAFIKGYAAPGEIFLVSLLSRSSALTVTPFTSATGPAGVDGLSAATAWTTESRAMHSQWVAALVKYLKAK